MKNLIFFCIAGVILLFSIITINIAPIIGGLVDGKSWMSDSCKYLSDKYEVDKDSNYANQEAKDYALEEDKLKIDKCNRRQAMVGLEYTAFNLNIIIGFICALLGLLHYLNLGSIGKIIGLIGLGGGAVGFVLTLVYVIESGLVFNNDYDETNKDMKIDSDGAFLEWDGDKYVCIFYDKDNIDSVYLKYSDLGNKFLSYNRDIYESEDNKYKEYSCFIW